MLRSVFVFSVGLVLAVFANSAVACPQLAGNFQCSSGSESMMMEVTQSTENGVTTYFIVQDGTDWEPVVADGMERPYRDPDGMLANAFYTATCNGTEMANLLITGDVMDNGARIGELDGKAEISVDANDDLIYTIEGVIVGDGFEFELPPTTEVCTRL